MAVLDRLYRYASRVLVGPVAAQYEGATGLGLRKRVLSAASWTVAGTAIGRLIGLLGTVLVTRILSQTEFGEFSAVLLMMSTVAAVAGLGLGVAATKRLAEARATSPDAIEDLAWCAIRISTFSGVAFTLGVIAV